MKNICDKIQILYAGKCFIQIRRIRQICDQLFTGDRIFFDRVSIYIDLAILKGQDTDSRLDRRCLSGSVLSDEAEQVPILNRQ